MNGTRHDFYQPDEHTKQSTEMKQKTVCVCQMVDFNLFFLISIKYIHTPLFDFINIYFYLNRRKVFCVNFAIIISDDARSIEQRCEIQCISINDDFE